MSELSTQECADLLGVTRRSIHRYKHHGFPSPARVENQTRFYNRAAVLAWAVEFGIYDDLVETPMRSDRSSYRERERRDLLSTAELAEEVGLSCRYLLNLARTKSEFPAEPTVIERHFYWTEQDAEAIQRWKYSRKDRRCASL